MHHDRFRAALASIKSFLHHHRVTSADVAHIVQLLDELSAVMHRPGATPEEKREALLNFERLFT